MPKTAKTASGRGFCGYFRSLGWHVAAIAFVDEVAAPARNLVQRLSVVIGGVFLASMVLGLVLSIRATKPLNALAEYAKTLPATDFTSEQKSSSPIEDLPARNKDEVGRLAEALMFMEQSLRENIRSLVATTAANERIEGELSVAREIQMGLLPKTFPPFPERTEFELYVSLESAREVGGDLYDFFFMDEEHFCFAVGDVSGKGVPAALFMAVSRTLFAGRGCQGTRPRQNYGGHEQRPGPGQPQFHVRDPVRRRAQHMHRQTDDRQRRT